MYKNWPHLYKQVTDKCINKIDHNWLKLAISQPQMYKNQPQMYKWEFSALQLPDGWTSVYLSSFAMRP